MKRIKGFNSFKESVNDTQKVIFDDILSGIKSKFENYIVNDKITTDLLTINFEVYDIEPEVGSYISRFDFQVNIYHLADDKGFFVKADGIAGQYGCDDVDDEDSFEPEFDFDVQSTNVKISRNDILDKNSIILFIEDLIKEYYM